MTLKTASATRLWRAALHEARNGVCYSITSCALQLGHSCSFQRAKWVTTNIDKKWTFAGNLVDSPDELRFLR